MRSQRFWVMPHVGKTTYRKLPPTYLVLKEKQPCIIMHFGGSHQHQYLQHNAAMPFSLLLARTNVT
jgi:hypothetical protein